MRKIVIAILASLLICSRVSGAWMPDYAQGLTNVLPTRALVTNLLAATQERWAATYTGTDTNDIEQFEVGPIEVVITNQVSDYSTPIVCGITTSIVAGVTNYYTNYCPTVTAVVVTNQIGYVPEVAMLIKITEQIEDMIPLFLNHTVKGTNENYDAYFAATTNATIPLWTRNSIFAAADVGRINVDPESQVTNAFWTYQPRMTNKLLVARASIVPTEYIAVGVDPSVAARYTNTLTVSERGVWYNGSDLYLTHDIGFQEGDIYTYAVSPSNFFDGFESYPVYYPSGLFATVYGFLPTSGDYWQENDQAPTNFYYEVFQPETNTSALMMTYVIPQTNLPRRIAYVAEYSNAYPSVFLHVGDTNSGAASFTVTLHGSVYDYSTNVTAIFGRSVTQSYEQITTTGLETSLTQRWVSVTNMSISGTATNVHGMEVAYVVEQQTDGIAVAFDAIWYKQALLERYKILNLLRETRDVDLGIYAIVASNGVAAADVDCTGPLTVTGYVGYALGGLSGSNYTIQTSIGSLPIINYAEAGAVSEYDSVEDDFAYAERWKSVEFIHAAVPVYYVSTQAPPAVVEVYAGPQRIADSDGRDDTTNAFTYALVQTITNAGTDNLTGNYALSYSGTSLVSLGGESYISDYFDALTNTTAHLITSIENDPITGCTTNTLLDISGTGVSMEQVQPVFGSVIRWQFEHLDE